ncbi:MAG: DNA primase family protein [Desulfovibrio sp.]
MLALVLGIGFVVVLKIAFMVVLAITLAVILAILFVIALGVFPMSKSEKELLKKEVETENEREAKQNEEEAKAKQKKEQEQRLKGGREVSRKILYRCYRRSEVGDGELAAALLVGKYFHDNFEKGGQWYRFDRTYWEKDINRNVIKDVDIVACEYEKEARYLRFLVGSLPLDSSFDTDTKEGRRAKKNNINKRTKWKKLYRNFSKRAGKIRNHKSINNILKGASAGDDSLGLDSSKLTEPVNLLPCANTVIDLATGNEYKDLPWSELFFRQKSPVEYKGLHAEAPLWDKTLDQVTCYRKNLREYLEYAIGFMITGIQTKDFFCFYGKLGDNGKTVITALIEFCLGEFASTVQVELLLEDKNVKSSGPREDLLVLQNKRLIITSEAESKQFFSLGKIKQFTSGGDKIRARGVSEKHSVGFQQTHSLVLHSNNIPQLRSSDNAFFNRLRLIPFDALYTSDPDKIDEEKFIYPQIPIKELMQNLKAEASGILSHLVRCAIKAIELGHMPPQPECMKQELNDYKDDNDPYGSFFSQCCEPDPDHREQAKWLYLAWKKYHMEENELTDDKHVKKHKRVGTELKTRTDITRIPKDQSGTGTVMYKGYRIKNECRAKDDPSFVTHF